MTEDPCAPYGWRPGEWEERARALGMAPYRGRQIFDAIHRRSILGFDAMTVLSKPDRERWAAAIPMAPPVVARRDVSRDGSVKLGLRLRDGALVETVWMPRGERRSEPSVEFADARAPGPAGGTREPDAPDEAATVCVSSQTGCAVDCRFCVTGRLGAGRDLSAGEIVAQVLLAERELRGTARAVVFMGMGEPLLNLEAVDRALDVLFETLSPRRVTVSTSGFPEGIRRLGARAKAPNLAVSINAADEKTRAGIMPVTNAHPLSEVIAAMREFPLPRRRRITAEYVLLAGVNDTRSDAARLARLLRGIPVKINLIPFNPDSSHVPEFRPPEEPTIAAFAEELAGRGYTATVRRSKGPDASAACGQLKGRERDPRKRPAPRG